MGSLGEHCLQGMDKGQCVEVLPKCRHKHLGKTNFSNNDSEAVENLKHVRLKNTRLVVLVQIKITKS